MQVRTLRYLTWLIVGLTLVGCLVGILVPAGLGWDFANFYDAGRRVAAGEAENLYESASLIAGQPPQGEMRFWGTPISALLYAPMSAFPAATALILFKIENVLAYAAALVALFLFCRTFVPDRPSARWEFAALFSFLCLIYQPFWTVFRVGGQTTATVFLLLTLALVFHASARLWVSALCVALATLIKPAFAPALLVLLLVSGFAFLRNTIVVLGVIGLASLALLGWPVHEAFLLRVLGGVQTTFPWYHNSSLYIVIDALRSRNEAAANAGLQGSLFTALTYLLKGAVLATIIYVGARSRAERWPDSARRHFHFMLAIAFFLLWSPTLWEHYLAPLFLLLAYVVASREHFSGRALALVAAIFLLSVGQNLIFTDWLRTRFAFDSLAALVGITFLKSGPLWLTLILLWRHYPELFRSYSAPAWQRMPLVIGSGRHAT